MSEERLRTSEAHLREAQRLTKLGSWERDYTRDSLHWSDEMFRITELAPSIFNDTFENYLYVVHPDDRSRFLQAAHDAHQSQTPYELEYRLKMPDGRVKWVHSRGTASYDRHGQPLIMTGTTQDITERKLADETLRYNEKLLSLIINAVPALIAYVDTECRYRLVNRAYEEKYGVSTAAICGCHVREVLGEAVWSTIRPFAERALTGEQVSYEVTLPKPLGGMGSFQASYTPDRDDEGRVRGFVGLIHDITTQKTAEQNLRRYGQRMINLEEEVRKKLAADLHDEMGPDLTALNFDLALIRERTKSETDPIMTDLLADASQLVDGLSSKVRNIITRLNPPVLYDYGLEAALRWYVDQMKNRTSMTISIVATGAVPRLPEEHELALFRIIKEALNNVVKYSGAKNVTVALGTAGDTLRLSVSDDGVGFDQTTISRSGAGGWGLTTMRERTIMLDGTFRLKTAPGLGTKIILEIPLEDDDAD